ASRAGAGRSGCSYRCCQRRCRAFSGISRTGEAGWSSQPKSTEKETPMNIQHELRQAIRDGVSRATAVVALAGVALIHVLDAPDTFSAAPYRGWLYVGLIAACLAAAWALVRSSDLRAWAAAAAFPAGAIVAFVISRTVGLPQGADDIGDWTEPLGLASLFVEGTLIALAAAVLHERLALLPRRAGARALATA